MDRFYYECLRLLKKHYSSTPDKCPLPDFGTDKGKISNQHVLAFEMNMGTTYRTHVSRKEAELQQLQKAVIRDSIRLTYFELGSFHYQYGFLNEAIKAWGRSLDYATAEEDLFNISYHLAKAAFEAQSLGFFSKYAGEAEARERSLSKTSHKTL